MSTTIDSLKQRKMQLHEVQAGPERVKVSVEMPNPRETRIGVSITLGSHSPALDSREVQVNLLGKGHFNPVEFPREGPLPELRTGSARGAVAAFRFEVVEPRDVTLAIGPEGGWVPEELAWAGSRTASLGPRNLRAENAAASSAHSGSSRRRWA